ncbi:hypothetical protein GLGCALEP_02300 [Pseudomonas sp. MM221]|nr:hypothetical protein DBADOPDK_02243 [Pseudomonas sp. MM223]CAI3799708.1 hypothetical protein GLGCALEP_02300 [Pseudomonas sp. MM221]
MDNVMIRKVYLLYTTGLVESAPDWVVTKQAFTGVFIPDHVRQ